MEKEKALKKRSQPTCHRKKPEKQPSDRTLMTFDTHLKFAYIFQSKCTQFQNLPLFQANQTSFYKFNEHLSITVNAKNRTIEQKSLKEWQKKAIQKNNIFQTNTQSLWLLSFFAWISVQYVLYGPMHCTPLFDKISIFPVDRYKAPKILPEAVQKHSRKKIVWQTNQNGSVI